MKSKFFRILGVATTVALLVSTLSIAPAMAITQPQVVLSDNVISHGSTYQVSFSIATALVAGDSITITLPAGTIVTPAALVATIAASPGWAGTPPVWTNPVVAGVVVTGSSTARTVTFTLNGADVIGATASIFINITAGIVNPPTAGDYTLTVATSKETTAVASAAYTIKVPTLEFPGIVKIYNSAGIQMDQKSGTQPITDAITSLAGGAAGYTLEIGPGFYNEPGVLTLSDLAGEYDKLIIKAAGSVAETIITADWAISADEVNFKGLTLRQKTLVGVDTTVIVNTDGNKVTFDGCTFVRSGATSPAETFVSYQNTTTLALGGAGTFTGCTFDASLGSVADTSVVRVEAGVVVAPTFSKNTFTLDSNATFTAFDVGLRAFAPVKLSENTFSGAFAYGVVIDAAGDATIDKNTFNGLMVAIRSSTATSVAKITNNTFTGNGYAGATAAVSAATITIADNNGLQIVANKFSGDKWYTVNLSLNEAKVELHYNSFTGAKGVQSVAAMDAINNWWGAATGPAAGFNSALVSATPYLGAEPSNGMIALDTAALDAKTTTGVVVNLLNNGLGATMTAGEKDIIGIASYAANPGASAPASSLKVVKYFDAYVKDNGPTTNFDSIRILFYGSVNAFSEVWVYSPFAGTWVKCSDQSVNTTSGFVAVTVTGASTPSLLDMYATPFVIVEAPPAAPGGAVIPQAPALGSVNVPIDTTFTWPAVVGAVSYEFEIAEEIGQADKFYLKDEVGSSTVNAFKLVDTLKYDTQYWWRVRAVNSLGVKSAWTTSFFTTEKEPVVVEPTPPVVIEQTPPPQITLEIPPAQVTRVEPIPAYLLWAVIAVGAILVIAVIVLIVRTRRIS